MSCLRRCTCNLIFLRSTPTYGFWYSQLSWFKPTSGGNDVAEAEAFEVREESTSDSFDLLEDGGLLSQPSVASERVRYTDGSTIDWQREEAAERERKLTLRARRGVRGVLAPIIDSAGTWVVVVLTGIGVGIAGAWLDVLVRW